MANAADLIIRVLADVSQAHASFASLGGALAAVTGAGAVGAGAAILLDTGAKFETAMSRIQQAYNNVDFAPGTQSYIDTEAKVRALSVKLSTSFEDVGAVIAQGSKITDEYGNKLPTDKVNEFAEANLRLQKSSQDSVSAIESGQYMAMLNKMYSDTDYKGTASEVAALTTQHPQEEATLWQAALGIARIGAPLGVSKEEALGVGNYLSDVGGGGMMGGASIGRMLLRMDTSADQVLDPVTKWADVKNKRDAGERLDDLQTSLAEAEAKRGEMYGQHGLKTEYRKHPSEVMASENRIAKLHREIADQQADLEHLNDPNRSWPRGKMNMPEMARTAGMDASAFAELFKEQPMDALLRYTEGMHALPASERGAAMTKAGIINVRDQQTVSLLSDQPASVRRMIGIAQGEGVSKTAINTISDVNLGTAQAKLDAAQAAVRSRVGEAGEAGLPAAKEGVEGFTTFIQTTPWDELKTKITGVVGGFDILNNVLNAPAAQAVLGGLLIAAPGLIGKFGPAAAGAAGAAGPAIAGALGPLAAGGILAGGLLDPNVGVIGRALAGKPFLIDPQEFRDINNANTGGTTVNIGDIHAGAGLDAVMASVKEQLTAAWNAAHGGTPVTGASAGSYSSHHQ